MQLNTAKAVIAAVTALRLIVYAWIGWHWWRLFKQRTATIFKKRFTGYLLLFTLLTIIYAVFGSTYRLLSLFFKEYRASKINLIMSLVFIMVTAIPWAWIELLRGWFMYYDLRLSRATTRREWRMFLQDTLDFGPEQSQSSVTGHGIELSHSPQMNSLSDDKPSALQRALDGAGASPRHYSGQNDINAHPNVESSMEKKNEVDPPSPIAESQQQSENRKIPYPTIEEQPRKDDNNKSDRSLWFGGVDSNDNDMKNHTSDKDSDWFIKNVRTFGNRKWMNIRIGYMITGHLSLSLALLSGAAIGLYSFILVAVINLFVGLIHRGSFLYLFYKTPPVNDCIYIRFELKWSAILNAIGVLGLLVPDVLKEIFHFSVSTFVCVQVVTQDIPTVIYLYIILSMIPGMLCVSGMINAFTDAAARAEYSTTYTELSLTPRLARKKTTSSENGHNKSRKLVIGIVRKLLTDNDGFQLFMAHLMHEFSAECLLSVVEFVTFKQYIIDSHLSSNRGVSKSMETTDIISPKSLSVKKDALSNSSLVLADSDAGKEKSGSEQHMKPPLRQSKTQSLDQDGMVSDESLPIGDILIVEAGRHASLESRTDLTSPARTASASCSDAVVVCAESLLVSADSQRGSLNDCPTTPTGTVTGNSDGSPAFFASLNSEHSSILSLHSSPTSRHSSFVGCPSRLRYIKLNSYRFPKCVKTPGLLRLVQRTRIDLATHALALFEKYISDDSHLEVNVSFATRERLVQDLESLGLFPGSMDQTEVMTTMQTVYSSDGLNGSNRWLGLHSKISENDTEEKGDNTPVTTQRDSDDHNHTSRSELSHKEWLHELSHVWDGIIDEMVLLMTHSCQRFTDSPEFDLWNDYHTRKRRKKKNVVGAPMLETLSEDCSQK